MLRPFHPQPNITGPTKKVRNIGAVHFKKMSQSSLILFWIVFIYFFNIFRKVCYWSPWYKWQLERVSVTSSLKMTWKKKQFSHHFLCFYFFILFNYYYYFKCIYLFIFYFLYFYKNLLLTYWLYMRTGMNECDVIHYKWLVSGFKKSQFSLPLLFVFILLLLLLLLLYF